MWKRFWRLSRSGTFEAFFDALAAMSETAHLVQMFDYTVGAPTLGSGRKGGSMIMRLAARVAVLTKTSPEDRLRWLADRLPSHWR